MQYLRVRMNRDMCLIGVVVNDPNHEPTDYRNAVRTYEHSCKLAYEFDMTVGLSEHELAHSLALLQEYKQFDLDHKILNEFGRPTNFQFVPQCELCEARRGTRNTARYNPDRMTCAEIAAGDVEDEQKEAAAVAAAVEAAVEAAAAEERRKVNTFGGRMRSRLRRALARRDSVSEDESGPEGLSEPLLN